MNGIMKLIISTLLIILLSFSILGYDFRPGRNVDGQGLYDIFNYVNVNGTTATFNSFFGDVTGDLTGTASVCTSWASVTSFDNIYLNDVSNVLTINETKLNDTIDARDTNTIYTAGNGISLTGNTFSVAGNNALTQDSDGLSVTADGITDTQLEYNTGQHLTNTSNVQFTRVIAKRGSGSGFVPGFAALLVLDGDGSNPNVFEFNTNGSQSSLIDFNFNGAASGEIRYLPITQQLRYTINNGVQFSYYDGYFEPNADNDFDFGTSSKRIKTIYAANINSSTITGSINWTNLQNYPTTCPGSGSTQTYVSTNGDSNTCTGISGLDTTNIQDIYLKNDGDTGTGNYTFDSGTLHIDSTNDRVGIGTASPGEKLSVSSGNIGIDNGYGILFKDNGGSYRQVIGLDSGDDLSIGRTTIDDMSFSVGDVSPAMTLKQTTGNLGIGVTDPDYKLDLEMGITNNNAFRIQRNSVDFMTVKYSVGDTEIAGSLNNDFIFKTLANTAGEGFNFVDASNNSRLFIEKDGKVGIGTDSPDTKLTVKCSTLTNDGGIRIIKSSTDLAYYDNYVNTAGDLIWGYTGTDLLTLEASGYVGIGVLDPTYTLDVAPSNGGGILLGADVSASTRTDATRKFIRVSMPHYTNAELPVGLITGDSDGTNNLVSIGGGTGAVNSATKITFLTSANDTTATGTTRMLINADGNIGIGTNAPYEILNIYESATSAQGATLVLQNPSATENASTAIEFISTSTDLPRAKILVKRDAAGWNPEMHFKVDTGTGTTSRMTILSDGNVGIGTTSPGEKLHVDGNINVTAGNDICIEGGNCLSSAGGGGSGGIIWSTPVNSTLTPDTDNSYNLGTSGAEFKDLYIDGTANIDAIRGVTQIQSSSYAGISDTDTGMELSTDFIQLRAGGVEFVRFSEAATETATYNFNGADIDFTWESDTNPKAMFLDGGTGFLGINTNIPTRNVHINDTLKIEPRSAAPSSAAEGDLYVDSDSNELCFYDGSTWTGLKAAGTCE